MTKIAIAFIVMIALTGCGNSDTASPGTESANLQGLKPGTASSGKEPLKKATDAAPDTSAKE